MPCIRNLKFENMKGVKAWAFLSFTLGQKHRTHMKRRMNEPFKSKDQGLVGVQMALKLPKGENEMTQTWVK